MTSTAFALLNRTSKRYSRRGPLVLDDVTLNVSPGSHTLILGSNGSGKSTLLALAARTIRPTSGTVATPGRVGYVPERLPASLRFSGAEYLAHMGHIRGLGKTETRTRADELLGRLGLTPGPGELFGSLSKGNQQKVMLAQAFLGATAIVVLDEPSSGLDRTATATLGDLIGEARAGGTAVLESAQSTPSWAEGASMLQVADGHLYPVDHRGPVLARESGLVRVEATAPPGTDLRNYLRGTG